jgi:DNA polymerase III subunit gamma/tau
MASQALYRKWRSQEFETVIGQGHVTLTLRHALRDGHMSHAYLFTGPRGTGKTSTARILAKAINCQNDDQAKRPCNECAICVAISEGRLLDLIEIDAASNRGIDEIRDLREKIAFRPNEARYKVYIIDEVHMLTKEAFNALLKTLEEPPAHAIFVLATTEPDRVPETVRSRCQRFDFRRIGTDDIVKHLADLVKREGRQAQSEALAAIARRSTGSMRDSISLLDQLLSYGDEVLTLERVENVLGLVNQTTIGKLVDHMAGGNAGEGLALLNALVAEGVELGQLADQVIAYLRSLTVARVAGSTDLLDLPQDVRARLAKQAQNLGTAPLLAMLKDWTEARGALRDQVPGVPQLPLEIALLRSCVAASIPASAGPAVMARTTPAERSPAQPAETRPPDARPGQTERRTSPSAVTQGTGQRPQNNRPAQQAEPEWRSEPVVQPEPETAAPIPPSSESDALRERVNANWDRFMVAVKGQPGGVRIAAALKNVKEVEAEGNVLVLRFASAHDFSREMIDVPAHKAAVEAAWRQILGEEVGIRCSLMRANVAATGDAGGGKPERPRAGGDALLEDAKRRGAVVRQLD